MKSLIAVLLVLAWGSAHAESHEELVKRAFEAVETRIDHHWAFTRTERSADGVYIATHDPRREQAWELLTVDRRRGRRRDQ